MATTVPDRITIDLSETAAMVTEHLADGTKAVKCMDPQDLGAILANQDFDTGTLMGDNYSVIRVKTSGGHKYYAIECRARKRDIVWDPENGGKRSHTVVESVPFPNLLFLWKVRATPDRSGSSFVTSRVYALARPVRTPNDRVYLFRRYGNVFENSRICWGTNNALPANDPMEIRGLMESFFTVPWNNHLGGSKQTFLDYAADGRYTPSDQERLRMTVHSVVDMFSRGEV